MKLRPTRRLGGLVAAALLVFGASWTAQAGWMAVVAALMLAAGIVSFILPGLGLGSVRLARACPAEASVGDTVTVALEAVNGGRAATHAVEVEDSMLEPAAALLPGLGRGEVARFTRSAHARRRGRHAGAAVAIRSTYPFGFVRAARLVEVTSPMIIYPHIEPAPDLGGTGAEERGESGAEVRPMARGATAGAREYRPGDPPRSVHWRLTARRDRLVVREREDDLGLEVEFALSVGSAEGEARRDAFERLVSLVASLGVASLAAGRTVRLAVGSDAEGESLASVDRKTLLDRLAVADPQPKGRIERAAELVARRPAAMAATTVLLGLVGDDIRGAVALLRAAGRRPLAILVRPRGERASAPGGARVVEPGQSFAEALGWE